MNTSSDDKAVYNLAIFPLKDSLVNFEDALKHQHLRKYELKKELKLDGVLYIGSTKAKPPAWKTLLQEGVDEALPDLSNTSNRALLLIRYDSRIYAIPFGYGKHLLREDSIDRDLALKTALNLLDPDSIRSIDRADLENFNMMTKYQSNVKARQEEFQVDPIKDLLRGLTGGIKNKESVLGFNITGSEGLYINPAIAFRDIKSILSEVNNATKSQVYKQKFEWVDNLKMVKDPQIINQLRLLLLDSLIKHDNNIILSTNMVVNWEDFAGISFSPKGQICSELQIEAFYEENKKELRNDWDHFLSFRTYFHFSLLEEPTSIPLWRCIIYEVDYDGFHYVLTDGYWYKVNADYAKGIREYAATFAESKSLFIDCDVVDDEGDYNQALANSSKDYFLLDKKLVSSDFYRSNLELCDVLTSNKELIHIKFYYSSATLSHLFSQGRISSYLLMRDESFRKNARKVISKTGANLNLIPIKYSQFKRGDYTITFAIIDSKKRSFVDTLPFFSLLNFRLTAEELVNWGYNVKVKKINIV